MRTKRHSAFTLMELMISIALALLLILGINEVFGLTAKTVGAGQTLSTDYQNNRGAQIVMTSDFRNMVNTAPLLIFSQYQHAFRSRLDQADNQSTSPSMLNAVGGNPSYTVPGNILHPRNQRVDTISFCARDLFQRQSGGVPGALISPGSSYEAYIWYGHLNIANNAAIPVWSTSTNPGVGAPVASPAGPPAANPNNYYSSQWVLGRRALLFQQSTVTPINGVNTTLGYVSGVEYTSPSSVVTPYPVQTSYLDVVSGTAGSTTNEGTIDAFTTNIYKKSTSWWGGTTSNNLSGPSWLNYRFQCIPRPTAPLSVPSAQYCAPAFIESCSQFCVEFAGDFVTQDSNPASPTYGQAINTAGPDGTIDFNLVNGVRQIRWYGQPRSVSPDNNVIVGRDIVRVSDVPGIPNGAAGGTPAYTFEKMGSSNTAAPTPYAAVWHPLETNNPRPKLIRITWAMDDPNNRVAAPVTFEYVFPVP